MCEKCPERPSGPVNLKPNDLFELRGCVAERYLEGTGVEFGALHAALAVPAGVTVTYADSGSTSFDARFQTSRISGRRIS